MDGRMDGNGRKEFSASKRFLPQGIWREKRKKEEGLSFSPSSLVWLMMTALLACLPALSPSVPPLLCMYLCVWQFAGPSIHPLFISFIRENKGQNLSTIVIK